MHGVHREVCLLQRNFAANAFSPPTSLVIWKTPFAPGGHHCSDASRSDDVVDAFGFLLRRSYFHSTCNRTSPLRFGLAARLHTKQVTTGWTVQGAAHQSKFIPWALQDSVIVPHPTKYRSVFRFSLVAAFSPFLFQNKKIALSFFRTRHLKNWAGVSQTKRWYMRTSSPFSVQGKKARALLQEDVLKDIRVFAKIVCIPKCKEENQPKKIQLCRECLIVGQESLRALEYLNQECGKAKGSPAKKGKCGKRYIKPIADNFRRCTHRKRNEEASMGGREARFCSRPQEHIPPSKPMQTLSRDVRYSENGKQAVVKLDRLLQVAPLWFSVYHSTIRNKLHYGVKVQTALSSVPRFWLHHISPIVSEFWWILDVWALNFRFWGSLKFGFGLVCILDSGLWVLFFLHVDFFNVVGFGKSWLWEMRPYGLFKRRGRMLNSTLWFAKWQIFIPERCRVRAKSPRSQTETSSSLLTESLSSKDWLSSVRCGKKRYMFFFENFQKNQIGFRYLHFFEVNFCAADVANSKLLFYNHFMFPTRGVRKPPQTPCSQYTQAGV